MKKEIKQKNFIPHPEYPGGPKAMNFFIQENLKYPKEAFQNKIEGTVVLKAEINFRGIVIDTKVISSLGHGCDEEAERVVRLLKFNVDKVRNLKITYFKTFNIHFKMQVQQVPGISYTYIPESKPEKKEIPQPVNFNYNIVIKL